MKRFPIFSTLIVGAAVATMIALGLWQLDRRAEKAALLALYRANLTQPAMAFPKTAPVAVRR
jgi:cytochrome oxidase assembly protein ShyY1